MLLAKRYWVTPSIDTEYQTSCKVQQNDADGFPEATQGYVAARGLPRGSCSPEQAHMRHKSQSDFQTESALPRTPLSRRGCRQ